MDYRSIREQNKTKRKKEKTALLAFVAVCAITIQCITIAALWSTCARYKALYNESLETQLEMQTEINSLKDGENISDEPENGAEDYEGSVTD